MFIALAQLNFHTGHFEHNTQKIINAIETASQQGADLVVFPELAVSGYPPRDFLEFSHFIEESYRCIENIASHCQNIAAIVGAPARNPNEEGKALFNAAWFLANGEVQSKAHKALLPTYDVFDEYRYFEPAKDFQTIQYKGYTIALTICEDLWYLDDQPQYVVNPMEALNQENPDFIVNIAASPFSYSHDQERKSILQRNASQYGLPLFYVNHIGAQTELIFDGGSRAFDAKGNINCELPFFQEGIETCDLKKIQDFNTFDFTPRQHSKIELIYEALILGIRDYFRKLNFDKAIMGLSGGIDSALSLAIASEALGKDKVLGVMMASPYTSKASIRDAVQLCENMDLPYETVPIHSIFEQFKADLAPMFKNHPKDVTEENLQARSRGVILMAISNKLGHIPLNTSNKSELAVGYGTLYGDLSGGLSVIGDVYKTETYELAHYFNQEIGGIPENIIAKPPTAELKPDQKDTDTLPPYHILDQILYEYIENRKGPEEIVAKGYEDGVVRKILKMVNQSEYKRHQTPPILRVSDKAFGMGRRLPIVAKYLS